MNLPIPDLSALSSMLRVLDDPRQLHAALVHVPIALAMLFPLGVLVLLCTGGRSHTLRWTLVVGYLLAAVAGWYAAEAGEMAVLYEHAPATRTAEALTTLERHEDMGDVAPIVLGVMGVLVMLTAIPKRLVRVLTLVVSLAGSVAAAGWIGLTAHHGGELVYVHGLNTPATPNNVPGDAVMLDHTAHTPPPSQTTPETDSDPAEDEPRKPGFFGIPTDQ